jgi:hypothetical protein
MGSVCAVVASLPLAAVRLAGDDFDSEVIALDR